MVACWRCNCEKGKRTPAGWRPEWADRPATQLSAAIDIRAGRAMARELYPRPVTAGRRATILEATNVNAEMRAM